MSAVAGQGADALPIGAGGDAMAWLPWSTPKPQPVLAPAAAVQARLRTCEGCPQLLRSLLGPRCNLCGCFVQAKARLQGERCPQGLWPC